MSLFDFFRKKKNILEEEVSEEFIENYYNPGNLDKDYYLKRDASHISTTLRDFQKDPVNIIYTNKSFYEPDLSVFKTNLLEHNGKYEFLGMLYFENKIPNIIHLVNENILVNEKDTNNIAKAIGEKYLLTEERPPIDDPDIINREYFYFVTDISGEKVAYKVPYHHIFKEKTQLVSNPFENLALHILWNRKSHSIDSLKEIYSIFNIEY